MSEPPMEFPLRLRPVLRSRQSSDPQGPFVPYHAAIWIVDASGRDLIDVAPDINDVLGGRHTENAHQLVARASRIVVWLETLHSRLTTIAASLESSAAVSARPLLQIRPGDRKVEIGFILLSPPADEFDRISRTIDLFAGDSAIDATLEQLRERSSRRLDVAGELLQAVREAIESWRSVEDAATAGVNPLVIDDVQLER